MKLGDTFDDNRGVATSLMETVVVIAVVAIVAGAAMVPALESLDDAKISRTVRDTQLIAMAVHNFMQDTGVPPAFKSGLATRATDEIFHVLETAGEDATDETSSWPTEADEIDLLENHLIENEPGETGPRYPRVGEISFNRHKGWNGPYLTRSPTSDPWGDRYLINVQFLTPQGVDVVREDPNIPTGGRVAVVVLSPGANRTIETRFDQLNDSFVALGDDIIFRIQ